MKIFKYLLLIHLFLNFTYCYAQNIEIEKTIEELKLLRRDSIIKIVFKLIDKDIELCNYAIRIKANNKRVFVSFLIRVKYIPQNSEYYYDIGVDIT
jgi:hypothetical protein